MNDIYGRIRRHSRVIQFIGTLLILGGCFTAGIASYRSFVRYRQEKIYQEASGAYEIFVKNLENSQENIEQDAQIFLKKYLNTPYAPLILLHLSQKAVQENKMSQALDYCMQFIEQSKDPDLQAIIRKRAANILLSLKQPQKALDLMRYGVPDSYISSYEELRGDIFTALKNREAAIEAYTKAKKVAPSENLQPLLQMKLDSLGNVSKTLSEVKSV